MAIIGLGRFKSDYEEFGATRLDSKNNFKECVDSLKEGEFIIFGGLTQTVVVEDEEHFKSLLEDQKRLGSYSGIYSVGEMKLDKIITSDNSHLNWLDLSRLMDQKRREGKFEYVKKAEGGQERKRS